MSKQTKGIKPFIVYLEGDRIEITKEMIEQSTPEVLEVYRRILWKQTKKEERRKRCLNPNGTRCKEKCATCAKIQRIDIKDPCNGLPLSLEEMEESGCPMPCSNSFMLPEEYVVKKEQYEELYAAVNTLGEKGQIVIYLYLEGLSDHQISAQTGIAQTTVSYRRRTGIQKLKKIMAKK